MNFQKKDNKRSPDELQQYLLFQKRGYVKKARKGKGSFSRKQKHRSALWRECGLAKEPTFLSISNLHKNFA